MVMIILPASCLTLCSGRLCFIFALPVTVFFAYLGGQVGGQTIKNGLADSLQTRESPGADNQIRTDDLRFTKA